jgi:outer membrane protein assembly factor BamE (lipoprotein component of BamABCDE complex)
LKEAAVKRSFLILLALTSVVYLSGCTTFETSVTGTKIDTDSVKTINPGTTTRADILATFGEPTEITQEGETEKMVYTYEEKKVPVYIELIKNEARAEKTVTTLEIILRGDFVSNYRFESTIEE